MSEDEILLAVVSAALAAVTWGFFAAGLARVGRLASPMRIRTPLFLAPAAVLAILVPVLRTLASADVVDDPRYVALYALFGLAVVGLSVHLLPFVGLDARSDVAERGNAAAGWAVGGAVIGGTLAFAGGNVGDGPGWWVVGFCAVLAIGVWLALFALADRIGGLVERITVDRDPSTGLRAGALLVSLGLVLGRAVAGDWSSAPETVSDFARTGWPAVPIALFAGGIERWWAPRTDASGVPDRDSLFAAVVVLAAGVAAVSLFGWPA